MRKLIPFDYAALGAVEIAWIALLLYGASLASRAAGRRTGSAAVVGGALLLAGLLRFLYVPREGLFSWLVAPVLLLPAASAGAVLLGGIARPRRMGGAWGAGILLLSLLGRPFGLEPVANRAEWALLALLGAAFFGLLRPDRLPRPVRFAVYGATLLLCGFLRPFGYGVFPAILLLLAFGLAGAVLSQGREMRRYVARRLLGMPVVLFLLLTISFFLIRAAPGGPFDRERSVAPEIREATERKYRLDLPLTRQYAHYLVDLAWEADFGPSFKQLGRSVNEIIARHVKPTALLGACALAFALLLGVTAGLVAGMRRNSIFDYASMSGAMLGLALPTFVVGPMLILVFAMRLDWFRVAGWEEFPRDLVLPALTLALPFAARAARLTRAGMLEVIHQDYIRTARAKGLGEARIVVVHAMKGAMLPVVSFLGPAIAQIFTGSLVVETIFGVPGLGREFVVSATNRDYPLVLGLVLFDGALLILMNLLVEVSYAFLDPRIRHG